MTMLDLALRGLRHRAGGFLATLLATVLGATILMAFASLLDTAAGPGVDAASGETLVTMTAVAGGWCLLIVVFAVASTLTLSVSQRAAEMALLRSVGATPAQVRRMIIVEAGGLATVAAVLAVAPGLLLGGWVFRLLRQTGQVDPAVGYRFGAAALGVGLGVTVLGATLAALLTARRVTRRRAAGAALTDPPGADRLGRRRTALAALLLATGLGCGVVTATVMSGKGAEAMQTAGQAGIWCAIGLALLAPALVRRAAAVVTRLLGARVGITGELTVTNLRGRSGELAGVVMPIILFTAISTGTLYMQRIEDRAPAVVGFVPEAVQRNITTLNYVVVGMIALFAAIMLVNTVVAVITHRRREFGQQRLAGATGRQVSAMVTLEVLVLAATGVLFGSAAALVTIVPYGIARTGSVVATTGPDLYAGIVAVGVALTLAASLLATRRVAG
jgi:putative ABC transport system permease protein